MESMKVKIGEYEIEIKARRNFGTPGVEYNRTETGYFLNQIATAYREASENFTKADQPDLAADFYNKFLDLYHALDKAGFYDDL